MHTDTSIAPEKVLREVQDQNKVSIVSTSDHGKYSGIATILITPNRRPKKIRGSLFGIEKELEYVLDWNQLVEALRTAHGLLGKKSK